jgi:dihydroflavonol-4-reductase
MTERELDGNDTVLVTGAGGFVGSAVVRCLVGRNVHVKAMVRPGGDTRNVDGVDAEVTAVDLRDADGVRDAARGCRAVFHVGALYKLWARSPQEFYDVNVDGTRNVLRAARAAGVERVVYTSTVGTLGLQRVAIDGPADEDAYPLVDHLFGGYKQSKFVAEHEALRAGSEGLPVVIVQPTMPVGPRDRSPTPTGKTVVDFLNGRMPADVDTTLNGGGVDDAAAGHGLAGERGRVGRSYILGGENLSLREILATLAGATGMRAPTWRVPGRVALGAGWVSDLVEGRWLRRQPSVPLDGVRMATTHMAFDDHRARAELDYRSRPASEALARAARWFAESGYVKAGRRDRFVWSVPAGCLDESRRPEVEPVGAARRRPVPDDLSWTRRVG